MLPTIGRIVSWRGAPVIVMDCTPDGTLTVRFHTGRTVKGVKGWTWRPGTEAPMIVSECQDQEANRLPPPQVQPRRAASSRQPR